MAQTDYSLTPPIGFAGQLADLRSAEIATGVNEEAGAIPFGIGVTKGTAEGKYKLPAAAGDKIYGFVIHHHDLDILNLSGTNGVESGREFSILEHGPIYVLFEQAMAPGDPVFVRHTAGAGGTQKGAVRKDLDTNTAAAVKGAQVDTGAAAGQIGAIKFDKLVNLS